MDLAYVDRFNEQIERLIADTDDLDQLNDIRIQLHAVEAELRSQFPHDRLFNETLLRHWTLQRRLQRKLRMKIIEGQQAGTVKSKRNNTPGRSPKEFTQHSLEYSLMNKLGGLTDEEFEAFLRTGRERGDLGIRESLRILDAADDLDSIAEEVVRRANLPNATRAEIAVQLGLSKNQVSRILKNQGIAIPSGSNQRSINTSLDTAKVIQESLHMIEDLLPVLEVLDASQLNATQARAFGLELAVSIGKLRTLARTLKRIEEVSGNTSTETNTTEEDRSAGSPEVGEAEGHEGVDRGPEGPQH